MPMEGYVPIMKVAHDYAATVMCHRFGTGKNDTGIDQCSTKGKLWSYMWLGWKVGKGMAS